MSASEGTAEVAAGNKIVDGRTGLTCTWSDLEVPDYEPPSAALVDESMSALPYVLAHARTLGELLVVARSRVTPQLEEELRGNGFALVDGHTVSEGSANAREAERGRLWLLTSGSTGRPKRVGHSLRTLATIKGEQAPRRWLLPYSPGTYAWWQVVTLGLFVPGQDLVVVDPNDLEAWPSVAAANGVTAASGTPTFWRQTIMRDPEQLARVPLQQITLGGEPVDQAVLDQLRTIFPAARISWIYASSEVGASIVVHDGVAGFPVEWLGATSPGRPTISVVDDELVIDSPYHGQGHGGPVRTGDRVDVVNGRVLIIGRKDGDEINVGGSKVSAAAVRQVLLNHPAVAWARVRGRKAPLVGHMVAADIVTASIAAESADLTQVLTKWCQEHLPEYGVPRRIRFLDDIPVKETLKSDV